MEVVAPILFGLIVGISLGLTGGGGSILAVPMLVYGLGLEARQAALVSLCAVGATAAAGAVRKIISREIEVRAAMIMGIAGIVGAPVGVWLGRHLPERAMLLLFSFLMITVAVSMWRRASKDPEEVSAGREAAFRSSTASGDTGSGCALTPGGRMIFSTRCSIVVAAAGLLTGILSGLFGVGGGFIVVPALMLIAQLDIRRAVATSLLVVATVSIAGSIAAFMSGGTIPVRLTLLFFIGGAAGLAAGATAAARLPTPLVQKVFSVVVGVVAVYVLIRGLI